MDGINYTRLLCNRVLDAGRVWLLEKDQWLRLTPY